MPSFFLALLAAALVTLGGREAVRVARLSGALGQAWPVLVAAWLACLSSCAVAAWLGAGVAAAMVPQAKTMLVAIALLLAALELVLLKAPDGPGEPTRAFGAILLVLGVAQLSAASSFTVFSFAAALASPTLAAAGGALGSGAVLTAAWASGVQWERRFPLRALRYGVASLLLVAGLVTGLTARGLI